MIAKSNILLDVKPWDDETDLGQMEKAVRAIEKDGLLWGTAKLVPVGYGIKKLQICCVVEDDKVGTDFLEEEITAIEDFVRKPLDFLDLIYFSRSSRLTSSHSIRSKIYEALLVETLPSLFTVNLFYHSISRITE